jgi:hypothetical protein
MLPKLTESVDLMKLAARDCSDCKKTMSYIETV